MVGYCLKVLLLLFTQTSMVGTMKGELAGLDSNPVQNGSGNQKASGGGGGGLFGLFKSLSGGKTITMETMEPVLEKMKEHLIGESLPVHVCLLHFRWSFLCT